MPDPAEQQPTAPASFVDQETGLTATQHDGRVWFRTPAGGFRSYASVGEGLDELGAQGQLATPDEVSGRLATREQDTATGQAKIAAKQVASHAIDVATGLLRYPAMGIAALTDSKRSLATLQELGGEKVLENAYGVYRELTGSENAEAAGRKYQEATRLQAEANPTTALLAGIAGDVAPVLLTGGLAAAGKLAGTLPSESIGEAAAAHLGEGVAAKVGAKALAGAIQGVSFGEQAASETAYLNSEPLTRQKLWAGGAMGGLFGGVISGGIGALGAGASRLRLGSVLGPATPKPPAGSVAEAIGGADVSREAAQGVAERVMAAEGVPAAPGLGEKLHSLLTDIQAATTDGEKSAIKDYGIGAVLDPKSRVKALSGWQMFRDRPVIIEKATGEIAESMKQLETHAGNGVFESVRDLGMKRNAWEKLVEPTKTGEQVDAARAFVSDTRARLESMLAEAPEGAAAGPVPTDYEGLAARVDSQLSKSDREAIHDYTTTSYQGMNDAFRDPNGYLKKWGPSQTAERQLKNRKLQSVLDAQARAGNTYRGEVQRVMTLPQETIDDWVSGGSVQNESFWSTTADPESMATTTEGKLRGNVRLHITESDAVPVVKSSAVEAEKEAIIPPGRTFFVNKDEMQDGVHHIWLEQYHPSDPEWAKLERDAPGAAAAASAPSDTGAAAFGDLKRVQSLLGHAKKAESALAGDVSGADAAIELDAFKRNLGKLTKGSVKRLSNLRAAGDFEADAVMNTAKTFSDTYENVRQLLMDEGTWGRAGTAQKEINQGWQDWIDSRRMYTGSLMRATGERASSEIPTFGAGQRYEIDPDKVGSWVDKFGTGRGKLNDDYIRAHVDATEKLTNSIGKYVDSGDLSKSVLAVKEATANIKNQLKVASETVAVANQVQLAGTAHVSAAAKLGMAGVGALAGGPIGAAAGAALGFLTNPGKVMQAAMAIQGVVGKVDAEKASALAGFFSKAASGLKKAETVGEFTAFTEGFNQSGALDDGGKGAVQRSLTAAGSRAAQFFSGGSSARAEQYTKRRDQLAMLASNPVVANHQIQTMLGALPGIAPQLASSLAMDAMRNVSLLQQMAPPASPVGGMFGGKRRTFTPERDMQKFADQWDGVMNPLSVLRDLNRGTLSKDKVDAARAAHPELFADLAAEFLEHMTQLKGPLNHQAALQADLLLGLNGQGEPSVEPGFLARIAALQRVDQADQRTPPSPRPPVNMAKGAATLSQSLEGA